MNKNKVDFSKRRWFISERQLDQSLVRLPWLARPQTFTDECTRCGKCVEACETRIIQKRDGGFPSVNFSLNECTFCYQCAQICPEPIFLPKNQTPWHISVNISDQCLAKQQVECRTCQDACSEEVIHFVLQSGRTATPRINNESCSGCGACVSVCPSDAITTHYHNYIT